MARYKIVDRRKKTPSPLRTQEAHEEVLAPKEAPASSASGDAAFALYEEFLRESTPAAPAAPVPSAPEVIAEEKHGDLIAPESVEPTVEFDLSEVRRAFEAAPKTAAADEVTPAPEGSEPLSEMLTSLFADSGKKKTRAEKKREEAASLEQKTTAPDPLPQTPSAGAGDTIRFDPISPARTQATQEEEEDVKTFTPRTPVGTRVDINDLVQEAAAAAPEAAEEDEGEFTRPEQAEELFVTLKKRIRTLWARFSAVCVLFLAILYLESACYDPGFFLPRPAFLTPGRFGPVFLLLDIQLLVLTFAAASDRVRAGFSGLFSGKAGPDSVACVALSAACIHPLVLLVLFSNAQDYVLFGSVSVFLALLSVARALLEAYSNVRTLRVLSDEKTKFAAARAEDRTAELTAFAEHLGEELPDVFTVSRANFVDGFLRRTSEHARGGALFTVGIPIVILLSVATALWCYLGGGRSLIRALGAFSCSMMMGLPACSVTGLTLPFFFASRRAAANGCTIVGESSVEEVCDAEIVSFDDTEVFLPKHVKVTSVRTYGAARIDKILIYCAQIFRVVGGPLSYVFENSISSLSVPGHVEISENRGEGIRARIDGKEIYVGGARYMEAYEFPVEIDDSDADFEDTVGRIMYLAVDGELAAKFYIRYALSARFASQLADLNRAGIYAAVKTCDPNVDAELLQKILHRPDHPIGVIKTGDAAKNAPALERIDAPLAANTKISAALNGLLICEAIRQRSSFATLVKFVSMLLGLFIAFVLTGMQNAFLTPAVCLIYQLIWLVPVTVPALFDWPKMKQVKKRR